MKSPEELFDQQILSDSAADYNPYTPAKPPQNPYSRPQKQPQQVQQMQAQQQIQRRNIKCQILLKQLSKLNKKLIEFFKRNLTMLNSKGLEFEWISVDDDELEHYEDQNIDKFPTLVMGPNMISGVTNIKNKLLEITSSGRLDNIQDPRFDPRNDPRNNTRNAIDSNKQASLKINNEESMRDYFMNELDMPGDDNGDEENVSNTISQRASAMNQARKNMGQHTTSSSAANPEVHENGEKRYEPKKNTNNIDSLNTVDIIKNNKNLQDDDMMDKYWANQEETEL